MTRRPTDLEGVRLALRGLTRGDLLIIAERAAELVPKVKLKALLGGFVQIEAVAKARLGPQSVLDEVRKFHAAEVWAVNTMKDSTSIPRTLWNSPTARRRLLPSSTGLRASASALHRQNRGLRCARHSNFSSSCSATSTKAMTIKGLPARRIPVLEAAPMSNRAQCSLC